MGCIYSSKKIQASEIKLDEIRGETVRKVKEDGDNTEDVDKKEEMVDTIFLLNNEEKGVVEELQDNINEDIIDCSPNKNIKHHFEDSHFNLSGIKSTAKYTTYTTQKRKQNENFFSERMLKEINHIRTNPYSYSEKLDSLIQYIKPKDIVKKEGEGNPRYNEYMFEFPNSEKVSLPLGETSFRNTIELIRNKEPIGELVLNEEIKIEIGECEEFSNEFIKNLIVEKRNSLADKYPHFSVNIDVITDPEVSAILQLVDDNPFQGIRRMALLNQNFSHFSVSLCKDKKRKFFSLICFA